MKAREMKFNIMVAVYYSKSLGTTNALSIHNWAKGIPLLRVLDCSFRYLFYMSFNYLCFRPSLIKRN